MTTTTTIVLIPTTPGRYAVRLGDEVIVQGSRDPEHDAARALLARGITGPMVTMRSNGVMCMRFASIEETARLTVEEPAVGLRLRRWKAFAAVTHASPARSFELEAVG